jgi:hypothetical protein
MCGDRCACAHRYDDRERVRARQGLRNPVPGRIKLDCCGEADEHLLKPGQISRGLNDEYIVRFKGYTFVIPADKASHR